VRTRTTRHPRAPRRRLQHSATGVRFKDVREKGEASQNTGDWFFASRAFSGRLRRGELRDFANRARSHPKLNTANPELREYLVGIGKNGSDEADVDGWRLDVAKQVDHRFLVALFATA